MNPLERAIQAMLDVQAAAQRLSALEDEKVELQDRLEVVKGRIKAANNDLDASKSQARIALKEAFGAI